MVVAGAALVWLDGFPGTYLLALPAQLFAFAMLVRRSPPAAGEATQQAGRRRVTLLLVLLAIVALVATLSEGALEWSAIYLRLSLGFPVEMGILGILSFHAAMGVGRLISARAIGRYGRRTTLAVAGLLVAIVVPITLASSQPVVVICGLLLTAAGISVMFSVAVSFAGEGGQGGSGWMVSDVIAVGYTGFLIGPAVIGGLAELATDRRRR